MKTIRPSIIIGILIFSLSTYAQNVQFSATTKSLLARISNQTTLKGFPDQLVQKLGKLYPIQKIDEHYYIGAIMLVDPEIDVNALEALGVKVNTRLSDIWTALIPLNSVEKLAGVKGLKIVDVGMVVKTRLDNATKETKVKEVLAGTGLPRKYSGDSVIVGIVDGGFDYTHLTFYDTTGTKHRILRAWEQDNESGTKPQGFNYGSEFVGTTALLTRKYSGSDGSHGTHVAGIAGGSGGNYTSNKHFMGVAPAASLIFVHQKNIAGILDGINYVFTKAALIDRPAVVNLSLGSHVGPHDGTSLTDKGIDNLVGPGKIVIGAAGNEGDTPLHIGHQFSNDTIKTFVGFENPANPFLDGIIDQWGSPNSDFSVSLLFTNSDLTLVHKTAFYAASLGRADSVTVKIGEDSLNYIITGVAKYNTNEKPNLLVEINRLKSKYWVTLIVTSNNSKVNIWNHGVNDGAKLYDTLAGGAKIPSYIAGDNEITVGEIGGTSKKIITVGAYVTRNNWKPLWYDLVTEPDSIGALAPFSSRGPTADGRVKPEITAPGEVLLSSYNAGENGIANNRKIVNEVYKGEIIHYFGAMSGTSMACPMVTGIVALMLQANPRLGPEQVKQMLQQNARQDSYTGNIGPNGSNIWGWGKVDAQQSVLAASKTVGIEESDASSTLIAYPNPSSGIVYLAYRSDKATIADITVRNMLGRTVYHQPVASVGSEPYRLDLSGLAPGIYIVTLRDNKNQQSIIKLSIAR
jgi:minor extracellular serine protease Vpr